MQPAPLPPTPSTQPFDPTHPHLRLYPRWPFHLPPPPTLLLQVPVVEPPAWAAHREGKGKAPGTGDAGTVYAKAKKSGDGGPTSKELELATTRG